jgi:transposase
MAKHHSEDYKITAVKYYKKNGSYRDTCKIFKCSRSSLHRWNKEYTKKKSIKRKPSKRKRYKVTKEIIKFVKEHLKDKPNATLQQLRKLIKKKFKVDLHHTTVYKILKEELNITRKKLRKRYYPEKKLLTEKEDQKKYYKRILKQKVDKIISIDETSIYLNMTLNYGRSKKGRRVYMKTHIYPFKKFNVLCAIKFGKVVGIEIYEELKGGVKVNEFNKFIDKYINKKYKNHLILLDNASFHRSKLIKQKIKDSKNELLYTIPYHPETNPIEEFFSQLKHYVKLESPQTYKEIVKVMKNTIKDKIKPLHIKNYFNHLVIRAKKFK